MALCSSGPEGAAVHDQSLEHFVSRSAPGETLDLCNNTGGILEEAIGHHKWLIPEGHNFLATDPWDKLKIADDSATRSPVKKKAAEDQSFVASPISTLVACWSPQAPSAPPLKTRKSMWEITCKQ